MNNLWMPCGGRDSVGPGTLCCSACNWTNGSLRNKIQRNYKGLKMTVCIGSWGKLQTKGFKKTKQPNCYFWRPRSKNWVLGAKAGYCACPPVLNTTKGAGTLPKPPLQPNLWTHPYSHSTEGTSLLLLNGRVSEGTCCVFLLPSSAAGAPVKLCLTFLSSLWSISVD